jgi:hypothetical protein
MVHKVDITMLPEGSREQGEDFDELIQLGSVNVTEQIESSWFGDLHRNSIDIAVSTVTIVGIEIDRYPVVLPDGQNSKTETLMVTSQIEGIHLIQSYYQYMDDVFFSQLCDQTNNTYGSALVFRGCQCSGFNFYGMPSLQFLYTVGEKSDHRK